jgi:hypothetical protein
MTDTQQHMMHTLDHTGDQRVMWDSGNKDEVEAARRTFDDLVGNKKYLAYRAEGKKGEKGEQLRKFDPEAERIILVKQHVGG